VDIKGKVAILTGGARIGQAVARELAQRGCALAVTYRGSKGAAASTCAKRTTSSRSSRRPSSASAGSTSS